MYKIDPMTNRIIQLPTQKFSDLGFTERAHLQEWLANFPQALGEELLIIQKEFDGFEGTRERLDLLAIDKNGLLVIIENKLDDSGRDVVWQAIKYASYCSNLSKTQIIDIYNGYLARYCGGGNARELLCEFLEVPDLDEVVLNSANKQRIMMVAANFRPEVTSTALWLLSHGINLQCFKVTPYRFDEELFLNIEQIIPTPEAKELMIGMSAKEADERVTEAELKNRHKLRLEFWGLTLEALRNSSFSIFNNISATKDHWINAGSGMRGVPYTLIFGNKEARVDLYISRADTAENKYVFDQLIANKETIEREFGDVLIWDRLDNKKACRIKYAKAFDGYNKDVWPEMIRWIVDHIQRLEKAFKKPLEIINKSLKGNDVEGFRND